MVAAEKKLRPLVIDTRSILPLTPLSTCSEEQNNRLLTNSLTPHPHHLTTTNKRYSMSFLHNTINIHNHQEELLSDHDTTVNGHRRSTSAGNESIVLPRNHSVPDLHSKRSSFEAKSSVKNLGNATFKKRWFQLPRMTLKRQASTPPRRGFSGLKSGLVEPPEPPPQLQFNLDWSSTNSSTLLWDNDVNNHSISTPNSPINIRRRCSGYGLETLTSNNIPSDKVQLIRRLSCPNYGDFLTSLTDGENTVTSPQTPPLTPNEITNNSKLKLASSSSSGIRFCNFQRPILKRGVSNHGHGAISSASSSTSSISSITPSSYSPLSPPSITHSDDYKALLFNVHTPNTNALVLNFSNIKSRTQKLKRKTHPKAEQKALDIWQNELLSALNDIKSISSKYHVISPEKKARYVLTRKFILREFYTTEINFWNQLNYTKVMFRDTLQLALDRHSDMAKSSDMDWFANLDDLMKFSSALILRIRNAQIEKSTIIYQDAIVDPGCQTLFIDVNIGLVLREIAERMVIFLRCALDYRANKKLLDQRKSNKAYALYDEKLALRKETRQFTLHDYLIIPIQRITRYDLLLVDLEKHTEVTHPDYENIKIARSIVRSLATSMNSVQKK